MKVALYGIGEMGASAARLLVQRGIPIVAAIARSPQKVGKDLSEVVGLDEPTGVIVSDDAAGEFARTEPDIVILTTNSYLADHEPFLETVILAGANAITIAEEASTPGAPRPTRHVASTLWRASTASPSTAADTRTPSGSDSGRRSSARPIASTRSAGSPAGTPTPAGRRSSRPSASASARTATQLRSTGSRTCRGRPSRCPRSTAWPIGSACPRAPHGDDGVRARRDAHLELGARPRYRRRRDRRPARPGTAGSAGRGEPLLEFTVSGILKPGVHDSGESWEIEGVPNLRMETEFSSGAHQVTGQVVNRLQDVIDAAPGWVKHAEMPAIAYRG
ncbi:hypothetical protein [Leucobacter soli]|uniref:hypothetical protein n=1 Tax=Leucobacter soli TaxID=2812850 RepID=UPI00361C04E9